ncbi:hypothetical protein MAQA_14979 [Listeria aquatica FSL S10-1188]|uniref:Uncharacterized protein n=1 Tax=Listeria aquatica FSL S10-1188 TaxID=1265818 RepID=W7B2H8_9LIST|nr:hypothetical protein MAQA_14979 [Listeria aquatica FSL S10-1188]
MWGFFIILLNDFELILECGYLYNKSKEIRKKCFYENERGSIFLSSPFFLIWSQASMPNMLNTVADQQKISK